eukprot:UN08516
MVRILSGSGYSVTWSIEILNMNVKALGLRFFYLFLK